ncbi:hypothetical protein BsWGS_21470 [Bradybaena similaris]
MGSEIVFLCAIGMVMSMSLADTQAQTEVRKCIKARDCKADDECCVLDPVMGNGVCKPMLRTAEACHTSQPHAWFPPVDVVTNFDRCPCQSGEICLPVDAGEMGICCYG